MHTTVAMKRVSPPTAWIGVLFFSDYLPASMRQCSLCFSRLKLAQRKQAACSGRQLHHASSVGIVFPMVAARATIAKEVKEIAGIQYTSSPVTWHAQFNWLWISHEISAEWRKKWDADPLVLRCFKVKDALRLVTDEESARVVMNYWAESKVHCFRAANKARWEMEDAEMLEAWLRDDKELLMMQAWGTRESNAKLLKDERKQFIAEINMSRAQVRQKNRAELASELNKMLWEWRTKRVSLVTSVPTVPTQAGVHTLNVGPGPAQTGSGSGPVQVQSPSNRAGSKEAVAQHLVPAPAPGTPTVLELDSSPEPPMPESLQSTELNGVASGQGLEVPASWKRPASHCAEERLQWHVGETADDGNTLPNMAAVPVTGHLKRPRTDASRPEDPMGEKDACSVDHMAV